LINDVAYYVRDVWRLMIYDLWLIGIFKSSDSITESLYGISKASGGISNVVFDIMAVSGDVFEPIAGIFESI